MNKDFTKTLNRQLRAHSESVLRMEAYQQRKEKYPERQYWSIILDCLEGESHLRDDRTGVGSRSVFAKTMRFDLSEGFPLFTRKFTSWKNAFIEFNWMLRGETNIKSLCEQGCNIWVDWPLKRFNDQAGHYQMTRQEFIDSILRRPGFAESWGDLGPVYGKQWRDWDGVDQLTDVIELLNEQPDSRRIIMEGWNVADVPDMALPPCHKTYQFYTDERNRLNCFLLQRSADMFLGVPYNIANLAYFTHAMAHTVSMAPGEIVWLGVDCHLYENHREQAISCFDREYHRFPVLKMSHEFDILDPKIEHVDIYGYESGPAVTAKVAV